MKNTIIRGLILTMLLFSVANAELLGRLPVTPNGTDYQAYYDTVLDITWLQDASMGAGSVFDDGLDTSDGQMTWDSAVAWTDALSFVGFDDWRLPLISVAAGVGGTTDNPVDCSTASELTCRDNELGYMFYHNMVNFGSDLFTNVLSFHWSGTEFAPNPTNAWGFFFVNGDQANFGMNFNLGAWAVRSGDVAASDTDADGVPDLNDNCLDVPNPDQRDVDGDGFGSVCDADLDNSCLINFFDLEILASTFFTADPGSDLNGDGIVNFIDLSIMAKSFFLQPGPSGLPNICDPITDVTLSGRVTFEHVPHNTTTNGLNYAAATFDPARNVIVEILDAGTEAVLANAETDSLGDYAAQVPINTNIFVRARAEMLRAGAPGWNVRVVDNTQSDALYVLESASFDTGKANVTQNLHAESGWGGSSYTGIRAAGPFALLDAVNDAMNKVLAVNPTAQFPQLLLKWSPDNNTATGDESMGEIGNTFFRRNFDGSREILLLGAEDSDTDEYDQHVVIHEWGHYFEDAFSRADTIGGAHSPGDRLDPRVAFSEGWGYAFAGITTGDPVTRDALGFGQASGFEIDVDENNNLNPGWFSEGSAQSIIYDVVDAGMDGVDATNLGFGPIYNLMSGQLAASVPPLTLFSFIELLKQENPDAASGIDAIVNNQSIDSNSINQYATGESNDAGRGADVLPVYTVLDIDVAPITVCTLAGQDSGDFGTYNKLSVRRFLRLSVPADGNYQFVASGPSDGDPDIVLHSGGFITAFEAIGQTETSPTVSMTAGSYVVEVYEFSNLTDSPRGDTCIDVSVQSL